MHLIEQITWQQYLLGLLALAAVYYLIILIKLRKQQKGSFPFPKRGADEDTEPQEIAKDPDGSLLEELEILVGDIRRSILEKAGPNANKAELLRQITARVANYGGLHQPAYRYALSNYIIQHSNTLCRVAFTEEELEAAWEGLPR